jgi:hypothetical protein
VRFSVRSDEDSPTFSDDATENPPPPESIHTDCILSFWDTRIVYLIPLSQY